MPKYAEERILSYSINSVFDVIIDVGSYPYFLPWCHGSRIYEQKQSDFMADLIIGFGFLRETWTSHVSYQHPTRIDINYIKGPMKYLNCHWTLAPHPQGSILSFVVDFEFKSPLFEKIAGILFEESVRRMIAAFENRMSFLSNKSSLSI